MKYNIELLNSYVFELNWERERAVARQLEKTTKMLTQQIHAFLAQLDHLQEQY